MAIRAPHQEIPKAYDPSQVEERLYAFWEERGYFTPTIQPGEKPFVIIMPPPNVTGELHLGHALTATMEDALTRHHRMLGEPTLWLPGSDHAGIATQMVVERALAKEGLDRHKLGREKFQERAREWAMRYRGAINNQHRRLGVSCDWTRERFTLDPGPSRAVRTTFVNLYKKGLVYRGSRIINWCPRCGTALSDLEVAHREEQGSLYYIRYPLADGSGHVTVATTRPETLLGDTGVAVHPEDERYRHLAGKKVLLPVLGRPIPVVQDGAIEREFGTGAVKVTPGHDATDFEIGQRHGLPIVNVMNDDGTLNHEAGPYAGSDRYKCREAIVKQLQEEGLLERVVPHVHSIGHCQRCDTVVEPLVREQWFVKVEPLAKSAIQAVVDGRIRIIPERFTKVYLNWMENIRDWCISRQLWWGHRIPVWYCRKCGDRTVEVEEPARCAHCASPDIYQDPDVIDTWFSSGLWTHSTLGWAWRPEDWPSREEWQRQKDDLAYFYPTSVMETGYDILFFWVARMIMLGMENMGEVPFHTVFLHGLIRDVEGAKMSKTRGNVIDPLEAIGKYGADALRFALTTGNAPGNDLRVGASRMEAGRNFANKIWNAARFVIGTVEGADGLEGWYDAPPRTHLEDRWVLSRLNRVAQRAQELWGQYQLGEVQREIYEFLWGEYCDWYIEMAKVRLRAGDKAPQRALPHVLERTLRLLHPFMPFVTEEVWQTMRARLPWPDGASAAVVIAPYPAAEARYFDARAEEEMGLVIEVVRSIRNARSELRIEPSRFMEALVEARDARPVLDGEAAAIRALARVEPLRLVDAAGKPSGKMVTLMLSKATVMLPLGNMVDLTAQRRRLEEELVACRDNASRLGARLKDPEFSAKAPEDVVERERQRLEDAEGRAWKLKEFLRQLPK